MVFHVLGSFQLRAYHRIQLKKVELKFIQLCSECNHVWIDLQHVHARVCGRKKSGDGGAVYSIQYSVAKTNEIDCEFGFNDLSGGVENNNSFISTGEWAAKGLPRQMQKSSNFSYAK